MARNALHYLEIYLGYEACWSDIHHACHCFAFEAAREAVFECPYLLTKNPKRLRESLPALINVLGASPAKIQRNEQNYERNLNLEFQVSTRFVLFKDGVSSLEL